MMRPDIASGVRAVVRPAHNPAARYEKAVRKIIAYLKATQDLGAVFRRGRGLKLSLFADVDYADICNDRRSVSGVAVMLGNTTVSASITTQHCLSLSTINSEAECMLQWLMEQRLLFSNKGGVGFCSATSPWGHSIRG